MKAVSNRHAQTHKGDFDADYSFETSNCSTNSANFGVCCVLCVSELVSILCNLALIFNCMATLECLL